MANSKLRAKVFELHIVKLLTVAYHGGVWDAIATHNIRPNEVRDPGFDYSSKYLSLDLFGEVVHYYHDIIFLSLALRERSNQIYPLPIGRRVEGR